MQFPYGISFDRKISGKVSRMYTDEQYIRVKEIVSKGNKDSINGTYRHTNVSLVSWKK